jgi:hypothetical protein
MRMSFKDWLIIFLYVVFTPVIFAVPVGLLITLFWHKKHIGEIGFWELSKRLFQPNLLKIVFTLVISILILITIGAYSYFSCLNLIKTLQETFPFRPQDELGTCKFSIIPFESGYVSRSALVEEFTYAPLWIKLLAMTNLFACTYFSISLIIFYKIVQRVKLS